MTDRTYADLIRTRGEIANYQVVEMRVDGHVATITMNDPETLNAFSPRMTGEIKLALRAAQENERVRSVILTGKGRAFTAGGDLRMMGAGDLEPIEQYEFVRQEFGGVIQQIVGMDKPVIAAVNGFAMGVGLFAALSCDMVVASDTAKLGTAYIHLGLVPLGVSYLLAKSLGYHRAFELCALGEQLGAVEACDLGLVNRVVPEAKLMATAQELAGRLADGPPRALGLAKNLLRRAVQADLEEHLMMGEAVQPLCLNSRDHKEAIAAMSEKRKPEFIGE